MTMTTTDEHGVTHKDFYGPCKHIRASLDYNYHDKGGEGSENLCISDNIIITEQGNY